jgi:hypothetical protein
LVLSREVGLVSAIFFNLLSLEVGLVSAIFFNLLLKYKWADLRADYALQVSTWILYGTST